MTVVLGIDAAWAEKNPSGVAVVGSSGDGWHCAAVAPSYEAFIDLAAGKPVDWKNGPFRGSKPDVRALLDAAHELADAPVDVVTVDMPITTERITGRREADDLISKRFGAQKCSTHSPSETRPGPLGASLTRDFKEAGYFIAHASEAAGRPMRLVEVFPHPALLVLLQSEYRVQYKVGRSRKYWPNLDKKKRISALIDVFRKINDQLISIFGATGVTLPRSEDVPTLAGLKRYEDALDALVCAWVGICYIEGRAIPFGDDTAAIWCPKDEAKPSRPQGPL